MAGVARLARTMATRRRYQAGEEETGGDCWLAYTHRGWGEEENRGWHVDLGGVRKGGGHVWILLFLHIFEIYRPGDSGHSGHLD